MKKHKQIYDADGRLTDDVGTKLHDEIAEQIAQIAKPLIAKGHDKVEVLRLVKHASKNVDIALMCGVAVKR